MGRRRNALKKSARGGANAGGGGKFRQDYAAKGDAGQKKTGRLDYPETERHNPSFELYYKGLGIVPPEEWEAFMAHLRQPLPAAFRITGSKSHAQHLLSMIKCQFISNEVTGSTLESAKVIPWYPNEMAWQLNYSRSAIRSDATLEKLHKFLIAETESGNISRQEAVSMLPPFLLDVQPHHKVLDMCAAPGSKTAQLIEFLHADESQPIPDGFVIANDYDNKRCYLMMHQVKRLQSANFMIVNHDASRLPAMRIPCTPQSSSSRDTAAQPFEALLFDRVLADVPCSGDGTARKNLDVWSKWSPGNGCHLHSLQLRILQRGLELLAVGGRLVYSTCSFNPVEDEAVVAAMLARCGNSVHLVESADKLPTLRYSKGMKSWKLMSKTKEWFEKFDDVPQQLKSYVQRTMFPPANVDEMHLDRCIRLLPHHQDTGGFFVAVFEKTAHLPWSKHANQVSASALKKKDDAMAETESCSITKENDNEVKSDVSNDDLCADESNGGAAHDYRSPVAPPAKKRKFDGHREDPFLFLEKDDPVVAPIRTFFQLEDGLDTSLLMVRSAEGKKKNLYLASPGIKNVVQSNYELLKFINLGVKCLARSEHPDSPCDYRLVQEGLSSIQKWVKGRHVQALKEDVVTLLSEENPYLTKISDHTREQLKNMGIGAVIFTYDCPGSDSAPSLQIAMTGWRGRTSCRVYVPKYDREHYLRLCGQDPSVVAANYGQQKKKAAKSPAGDLPSEDFSAGDVVADEELPEDAELVQREQPIAAEPTTQAGPVEMTSSTDSEPIKAVPTTLAEPIEAEPIKADIV